VSQVFAGSVLLPGEEGPGLNASIEMESDHIRLTSGEEELGSWGQRDLDVRPSGKGAFSLNLAGEELVFTPSSPSSFAEAMSIPLQPQNADKNDEDEGPKYDYDAAIDEMIANIKPLRGVNDEDDILSKPVLVTIVTVAAGLMAGLVGMSLLL
jgi:hypothetical protein